MPPGAPGAIGTVFEPEVVSRFARIRFCRSSSSVGVMSGWIEITSGRLAMADSAPNGTRASTLT